MFLHVEKGNDPQIEELTKEKESILKEIANLEATINDLNSKMLQSEDFIAKLPEAKTIFWKSN